MKYTWLYEELHTEEEKILHIASKMNVSAAVIDILFRRGMNQEEAIRDFLFHSLSDLHDPFMLQGMKEAVSRIEIAIAKDEKITVYGDYDVDGMTGVAVLYLALKEMGAKVDYYIPSRLEEGYGLNGDALTLLKTLGTDLVITVDTGITGIEEANKATEMGLDLIITDHHTPLEECPRATAVINPKQKSCPYTCKDLAGVGVAYKVVEALLGRENASNYLDLVALGTVADMVPLIGENRILVKEGLKKMKQKRAGLYALMEQAKLNENHIQAEQIGYVLAPRINASGRIGNPDLAVELLTTNDYERAKEIAFLLEEENTKRRKIEEGILEEVFLSFEQKKEALDDIVFVIKGDDWHTGVIGIVASRILEKYHRPVIVLTNHDGLYKGSGRSISGINLYELLKETEQYLVKFGGHTMAAGLSLTEDNIEPFKKAINQVAKQKLKDPTLLIAQKKVDDTIALKDVDDQLFQSLQLLEPYGHSNPKPLFVLKNLRIKTFNQLGLKQNHLKITFSDGDQKIDGIFFHENHQNIGLYKDANIEALGYLSINEYKGQKSYQVILKDLNMLYNGHPVYEKMIRNYSTIFENSGAQFFLEQFDYTDEPLDGSLNVINVVHLEQRERYLRHFVEQKATFITFTLQEAFRSAMGFKNYTWHLESTPCIHFVFTPIEDSVAQSICILDYPFTVTDMNAILNHYGENKYLLLYPGAYQDNISMMEDIFPGDEILRNTFKLCRHLFKERSTKVKEYDFMKRYFITYKSHMSLLQLKLSLIILEELSLIQKTYQKDIIEITMVPYEGKLDLNDSKMYQKISQNKQNLNQNYGNLVQLFLSLPEENDDDR